MVKCTTTTYERYDRNLQPRKSVMWMSEIKKRVLAYIAYIVES